MQAGGVGADFILHPLMHTRLEFILAQNIGSLKGRDVEKKAASTKRSSKVLVGAGRNYERSLDRLLPFVPYQWIEKRMVSVTRLAMVSGHGGALVRHPTFLIYLSDSAVSIRK